MVVVELQSVSVVRMKTDGVTSLRYLFTFK